MNRPKLKILVAEDSATIRQVLCEHLVHCKHEAYQAADGEQAIAFLEGNHRFDIVMTDYRMPKVMGLDVIRAAKRTCPNARIWFMSGDDYSEELAGAAMAAGATKCFKKPNLFNELRLEKVI